MDFTETFSNSSVDAYASPLATSSFMQEEENKNTTVTIENKFGTLVFEEADMVHVTQGLVGFPEYQRFALAALPETGKDNQFRLLQSLDEPDLSFIVFPTTIENALLDKVDIEGICQQFSIPNSHVVLLHIATIRDDGTGNTNMSLNLKAPIIVDAGKQTAVQYVLPSNKYAIQHPVG